MVFLPADGGEFFCFKFQVSGFKFQVLEHRLKKIYKFLKSFFVFKTHRHIDFYTELHRVFLKWIVLREIHRVRSFGRCTWMGTRLKWVRLGGALVVVDFLVTFCLRYFDLLSNRLGNGFVDHCLRVPQATVGVVLMKY